MEKAKKARSVLRRSFSKQHLSIATLVVSENVNLIQVKAAFNNLEVKYQEIRLLDKSIFELMLENASEEELDLECTNADEYLTKLNLIKEEIQSLHNKQMSDSVNQLNMSTNSDNTSVIRKFRLPLIEIKKFSGEIKDWLQFWGLFKKVDEDPSIDNEEKFQYLTQATAVGSRARDVVESFPPTGDNYTKAVQALKTRYGREDLLIEIYVRELLGLVLQKSLTATIIPLTTLYDKLECQMRALDSLGVTTDKCSSMLFPLIESCMPEELLRAWQRSHSKSQTAKDKLEELMLFMRTEVENEEKVSIAMAGFGSTPMAMRVNKRKTTRTEEFKMDKENTPTAAGLLATNTNSKTLSCIFCNSVKYNSHECPDAQKMSLVDKKQVILDKACCFICLKPGHISKKCRVYVKCSKCQKRHSFVMCPELPCNRIQTVVSEKLPIIKENTKVVKENNLTSLISNPEVILQTLVVILRGNNGIERKARALIDNGSQRSYILTDSAVELAYEPINEEKIIHSLFGGLNTEESTHKAYRIYLSSYDRSYHCNFLTLDHPKICGKIRVVSQGPWEKELARNNIILTDNSNKIELLIGADVAGKLLTGNIIQLQSGLTAIQTYLGWTIIGKYPELNSKVSNNNKSTAMTVTSMLVNSMKISDLWELDVLGINDPFDKSSKEQLEKLALKHFQKTVSTNTEGRYIVHLPWVEGHPPLPTNYNLATRRLDSTIKKLQIDGYYLQYEKVFMNG